MEKKELNKAVLIREFEAADNPAVQRIYYEGVMEMIPDTAFRALRHYPESVLLYGAMIVVCFILTMSLWVIALVPAIVLCLRYFYSRRVVHGYLREAMKDMGDIENFYIKTPGSCLWVAVVEGKVVGLVAALGPKEGSDSGGALVLQRMSVDRKYRQLRVGVALGRKLLEFAVDEKYSSVVLGTTAYIPPANRLYQRLGFRCMGVTNGHTPPGSTQSILEQIFYHVRMHHYVMDLRSETHQLCLITGSQG